MLMPVSWNYAGPRFVAPDLCNDENGEQKFSVQSFLVSPEELTLLKPSHTWTTTSSSNGELSIDSQMLRQLSEAGMTIGRQIEASAVEFVLQSTKDMQTVKKLAQKLQIGGDNENVEVLEELFAKMKQMVTVIQQKTENGVFREHEMHGLIANDHANGNGNNRMNGYANGTCNGIENHSAAITNGFHHSPVMQNGHSPIANGTGDTAMHHLVNLLSTTILQCVATSAATSPTQNGICQSNQNNSIHPNSGYSVYELISQVLESNLVHDMMAATVNGNDATHPSRPPLDLAAIAHLLSSPVALQAFESHVNQLVEKTIQISKVNLIRSTISKNIYNDAEIVKNICVALDQEEDMIETVRTLSENEPKLLYRIISHLKGDLNELKDDASTVAALKRSVIAAVKESAINEMNHLLAEAAATPESREHGELNVLLMETAALVKALGLNDMSSSLTAALGRPESAKVLLRDDNVMEMIQRVVVMKKMAAKVPELRKSLHTLHTDPFSARKDPNIRMLLRRSGVCTIDPVDKIRITDSNEVPISLFCSDNQLAMEDFLMRRQTKARGAFLIMKEGLQAVVPRESSRDVLTGKCAYTVLDEDGIRHFEPLHVFSALKMHVPSSSHRFSIYSCDVASDDMEAESVMSTSGCSQISGDVRGLVLFAEKDKLHADDEHTEFFNKRRLGELCANDKKVIIKIFRKLQYSRCSRNMCVCIKWCDFDAFAHLSIKFSCTICLNLSTSTRVRTLFWEIATNAMLRFTVDSIQFAN